MEKRESSIDSQICCSAFAVVIRVGYYRRAFLTAKKHPLQGSGLVGRKKMGYSVALINSARKRPQACSQKQMFYSVFPIANMGHRMFVRPSWHPAAPRERSKDPLEDVGTFGGPKSGMVFHGRTF